MRALVTLIVALGVIVATQHGGNAASLPPRYLTVNKPYFTVKNVTQAKIVQEVYDECNLSRQNIRFTEAQCVEAQDATGTEFLCQERNSLPNNVCWVEFRPDVLDR